MGGGRGTGGSHHDRKDNQAAPKSIHKRSEEDHHPGKHHHHHDPTHRGGRGGAGHRAQHADDDDKPEDDRDVLINRGQLGKELAESGEAPLKEYPRTPYTVKGSGEVEQGIRSGTHVVAAIRIPKWTSGIAFAQNPLLKVDVVIGGIENRRGALPGDLVAIKLLPRSEWEPAHQEKGSGDERKSLGLKRKSAPSASVGRGTSEGDEAPATLPDGREIWHVLSHADRKSKVLPAVDVTERICGEGKLPMYDWPQGIQPKGEVVEVLERSFTPYQCCRLFEQPNQSAAVAEEADVDPTTPSSPPQIQKQRYYKFKPYNEAFPFICVYGRDIPSNFHSEVNHFLFLVELPLQDLHWVEGHRYPVGKVVRSLGKSGTVAAESAIISFTHEVKDAPFTEEVEACVMERFEIPAPEELKRLGRRDLRQEEFVCTIDPATARDLDDALSIRKTSSGYRVGVHIADVSYFVPLASALDDEAKQRATSTYFVERVIPMLPRRLCEDYCSLNAGVDKFAFSCLWDLDHNGRIQSEWFGQSVIRNSCRMAYEDAQNIIDGDLSGNSLVFTEDHDTPFGALPREEKAKKVVESVQLLFELATRLREARFDRGALSLNKRKLKFVFENMDSALAPAGITTERGREANWTIEEFMLLANCRTAMKNVEYLPDCTLLRKHDPPRRTKLGQFIEAAKKFGFDITGKTGKGLSDSLAKYAEHPDVDVLRLMATMCMSLAKYANSMEDEDSTVEHFALAVPVYAHFTSPIRRYADLVTHRQLLLALDIEAAVKRSKAKGKERQEVIDGIDLGTLPHGDFYLHPEEVTLIAENCNKRKEAAKAAGEASSRLFLCLYIEAMRAKSHVDETVPKEFCVRVVIVRIKEKVFMVHCDELSQESEIFHNAGSQRWKRPNDVNEKDGSFIIDWGENPSSGETNLEKVTLFSDFVATIKVVTKGSMTLEFVLHPPWQRDPKLLTPILKSL